MVLQTPHKRTIPREALTAISLECTEVLEAGDTCTEACVHNKEVEFARARVSVMEIYVFR